MTVPKPHLKHRTQSAIDNCLTCSPLPVRERPPGLLHPRWAPHMKRQRLDTTAAGLMPGDQAFIGQAIPGALLSVQSLPVPGDGGTVQIAGFLVNSGPDIDTRAAGCAWYQFPADEVAVVVGVMNVEGHRLD